MTNGSLHPDWLLSSEKAIPKSLVDNGFKYVGVVANFETLGTYRGTCLKKKFVFYETYFIHKYSIFVVFNATVYQKDIPNKEKFSTQKNSAIRLIKRAKDLFDLKIAQNQKQLTIQEALRI